MPVYDDERDSTMQDVSCGRCGTSVRVRKNSFAQTSIQWHTDPGESCAEMAAQRAAGRPTALVPACESLRDSIDAAVAAGVLVVHER